MTAAAGDPGTPGLQPLLHDLASCVAAPAFLLASPDGQIRPGGLTGWYADDVRVLDVLELSLDGSDLELVRAASPTADRQEFAYVARGLSRGRHDPTVVVERRRELTAGGLVEEVTVSSVDQDPVDVTVRLALGSDLAAMSVVKQGGAGERVEPGTACTLRAEPQPEPDDQGRLVWRRRLERGDRVEVRLTAVVETSGQFQSGLPAPWSPDAGVDAPDIRLRRTVEQSLTDLAGLLLADEGDRFLAAGSPWFLTLFGRDSLWAARMLIPLDTGLALSTLRVLARRQGTRDDPSTEEQPGKILHEVRNAPLDLGDQVLPPLYYGSVDATALFVGTLAEAHAWGADDGEVAALLPAARRCLEWLLTQSAESGWLRYVDHTGHGLSNQGWKDSADSVQFADGTLAEPPIALCEVQAYAYEAAVRGAELLAAYDEPEVPGLAAWAADLRTRFAGEFWVDSPDGGHLAIALDSEGRPADSVTSNMGHVLGTGILDPDRAARVAELLGSPALDSGFGLRTLAADAPRFSRLSYHGGTVWPHDTAIAVRGLVAEGHLDTAAALGAGVLAAAEGFGYRLPELYGGDAAADVPFPMAYPAACRPQAWSAAAPLAVLLALTGVRVDAARRLVTHPARTTTRLGAFSLRGLRLAGSDLSIHVAADGAVRVETGASGIDGPTWVVATSE
ncbi:MAG TPA: glycogen debranching N-terminal domain-containing protein [Nocardioides sp.]|nr:glycogen debranching N-terminal domain-containing protein [Nocardioides sp.]